jgi:lipopolysaccharide export system protein LptC
MAPAAMRKPRLTVGTRIRRPPSARGIARRRIAVMIGKFLLPAAALGLLGTIAIWPELDRATEQARIAFRRLAGSVEGATMTDARYRGADERGRPYTVTAEKARQSGANRVDLTAPKGDIRTENGGWLFVQSRQGVFMQQSNQLDLSGDVLLYRDDGMSLRTDSVAVDLKAGAAASAEPVQVEGPLGTLAAQGFAIFEKGDVIQFTGPLRMVVNATEAAPADGAAAAPGAGPGTQNTPPPAAPPERRP